MLETVASFGLAADEKAEIKKNRLLPKDGDRKSVV